MRRCWCQSYRAEDRQVKSGVAHDRGMCNPAGDCMYASVVESKDNDMREQVRGSFVRVSEGMIRISTDEHTGETMGTFPGPGSTTVTKPLLDMVETDLVRELAGYSSIGEECGVLPEDLSCDKCERLTADRAALIRLVEELVEQELPDVDVHWYRKRLASIRAGHKVHDVR